MAGDEVKPNLAEVVVEPFGDLRFHLAQTLSSLSTGKPFNQVGLAGEPVADELRISKWEREGVGQTRNRLREVILRVEPAEAALQLGVALQLAAIKHKGHLLRHLLHIIEQVPEGCGHGVPLTNVGMRVVESVDVQTFGHGLRPLDVAFAPSGVALRLRHHIAVADRTDARAVLVDNGMQPHMLILAREA